jgi:NADPH:quinone reductase-like Zn-dependent oxidoreductase
MTTIDAPLPPVSWLASPLPATMRAATARSYGPPSVMALETLPRPDPDPGQVLIRVAAFGVTRGDTRIRGLDAPPGMALPMRAVFGLTRPRRPVPGREFAGTVAALDPGVTGWAPGQEVFGLTDGMSLGAGAEFLTVSAKGMIRPRPDTLSAAQAAAFAFGGLTAADFLLDQMALRAGERLLVLGATGAVGSAAVQIAAHLGAQVTGVCSPANHALARTLGASVTHDYRQGLPPGPFDAILDLPGVLPWPQARAHMAPGGRLGLVTAGLGGQLGAMLRSRRGGHRLCAGITRETPAALDRLLSLHAAGAYTPVLGAVLPLAQITRAHTLASSGHKHGNVVVQITDHTAP